MTVDVPVNPLVAFWMTVIAVGVGSIVWAAYSALDELDNYVSTLIGKGSLWYGILLTIAAAFSWWLWHYYYACPEV